MKAAFQITLSPENIAELFCNLDSSEQARFFNEIGRIGTPWLTTQLQHITDEDGLTLANRRAMSYIGDYSHWGIVPKGSSI